MQYRSLPRHTQEYWPVISPRVERLDPTLESHLVSTLFLDHLIETSYQTSRVRSAESLDKDQLHLDTKNEESNNGDANNGQANSKETSGLLDEASTTKDDDDDDDDDAKEEQRLRDILVPYMDRFLSSQV